MIEHSHSINRMPLALPLHPEDSSSTDDAAHSVSRRNFLGATCATLLASVLAACGGGADSVGGVTEPPPSGSTTFTGGVVTLQLSQIPALTATNGHQVLALTDGGRRADLVIINVGGTYKAFTSICTHEGCSVNGYTGQRMVCPCHGSEYDLTGKVVAGPAPLPLREYTVVLNSAAQTLTIAV
ncbi:MAG: Rieske 2Fe-2S domain-containing protein [Gemmatimonadaceae bacterium]